MPFSLGTFLSDWRARTVLPYARGTLLDLGCGTSRLVAQYRARHGSEAAVGVDVHPWPGVDRVVADSAALPYADASFDTVTIVAALNHIPERAATLREAHRVLKPGGQCIITMIPPRLSRAWHWLRRRSDPDQAVRGMKPGELFGLSRQEVRRLLVEAGFEVVREVRFMLGLNCMTLARKL